MGRRGRRTKEMVTIARQRIEYLFTLAQNMAEEGHGEFSDRYVELAVKIGMRYNIRIPREYRTRYCRHCHSYLLSGNNSKLRFNKGKLTVTCMRCGYRYRYPYRMEQKAKRGGIKIA